MRVIRYSKQQVEFAQELRNRVKEYFTLNHKAVYGNYSIGIKSVVVFLTYLVPFVLMLTGEITSIPLLLICWIIMGMGMAAIGMAAMHDANHGSYSGNKMVNRLIGNSMYLIGGFPANWRVQHNTLHHGFTNVEGHDEDIASKTLLRFSPHQPLLKVQRYQHIYAWFLYSLMTISWITTKDFQGLFRYRKMGATLSASNRFGWLFAELLFSKLIYYFLFLVVPLIFIPVSWYWIALGFLLMHQTCGLILTVIFQTAHVVPSSDYPMPDEQGKLENSWMVHQLYTTSNFAPRNRFLSWWIGGLNYQVEHHLFPNISHVHYRKLAPIVQETAQKYNLPYYMVPTFAGAVRQHYIMLKVLGRPAGGG